MATGKTTNYELPFPQSGDAVNVHGDIKTLTERLDAVLPQASYVDIPVKNSSSSTISAGSPVRVVGHDGTNVLVNKVDVSHPGPILGLVRSDITASSTGVAVVAGVINNINTSSYSAGQVLYVGAFGGLTGDPDDASGLGTAIATVVHPALNGSIIVGSKSSPTWGSLKAGLS